MLSFSSLPGLFSLYKLVQNLLLVGILSSVNPPGSGQPLVLALLLSPAWLSLPLSSSSSLWLPADIPESLMCAGHVGGKSNKYVFSCRNREVTPWLKEVVVLHPAEERAELVQLSQRPSKSSWASRLPTGPLCVQEGCHTALMPV